MSEPVVSGNASPEEVAAAIAALAGAAATAVDPDPDRYEQWRRARIAAIRCDSDRAAGTCGR
jgi:hypothetical protein